MVKRLSLTLQNIAAALLAFTLPFSSFPLVGRLIGSSMVAPLSVLPLLVLLAAWFLPYLLRGGKIPPQSLPLLGFALVSLASAAAAFTLPFPPYKSATLLRSELEALASLAVGVCFYLVLSAWAGEDKRIRFLLRWVNWGGVLMLAWTLFQAGAWRLLQHYPDWMWNFQGKVSSSLLLYVNRANGFAYEPSWLAHQLNMVYLPFWLAATLNGVTAHRHKLWKISLENVLLLAGIAALLLSVSRIGLLSFLGMVGYLVLKGTARLVGWLPTALLRRFGLGEQARANKVRWLHRAILAGSILAVVLVYAGLLAGAAYGLSRYDERMSGLFNFTEIRDKSFFHYANQLVFAERIVFWQAGWDVFGDYPLLGVGPGNAGFLFPQKLSAFSWALTEIRMLMYQWTALPNIKSLWVRLLAETGIIGFALFACFYYLLWQSARYLGKVRPRQPSTAGYAGQDSRLKFWRVVGLAGELVLVGIIVEGFSIDTFALPYYWFSFALLTAACENVRLAEQKVLLPGVGKSGSEPLPEVDRR